MADILESKHDVFTSWAQSHGVVVNGVAPSILPGKGVGVVATRALKKGETIVSVPAKAFIDLDSEFVQQAGIPSNASVHATVAAALTLKHEDEESWYRCWQDVWPTMADFEASMPFYWGEEERALLTPYAKALLEHQEDKYIKDLVDVKARIPEELRQWYRYYWLVVSTRCFFWEYFKKAKMEKRRGRMMPRDDCLALCPWADYFNHADAGCPFMASEKGGAVVCDRNYAKGEEVVVSYGGHSNDYLLVEYGFILETNKYDSIKIDHIILPMLKKAQSDLLDEHGYLTEYAIDGDGLCYRSQVAVRAMVTSKKHMHYFLSGVYDGAIEDEKLVAKMPLVLDKFEKETIRAVKTLQISHLDGHAVETMRRRRTQILSMIGKAREAKVV